MDVAEEELQTLYTWVDEIPLSRPKKNIARDFADGVLLAEILHHYFPKLVELHNYSAANGLVQKLYNWNTLNQKVFRRLGFVVAKAEYEAVANCEPGAIERVLKLVKLKTSQLSSTQRNRLNSQESDSNDQDYDNGYGAEHDSHQKHVGESKSPTISSAGFISSIGAKVAKNTARRAGAGDTIPASVLADKEQTILDLRETNEILETKVRKLEQLVRLKDAKIQTLLAKMQAAGLA